MAKKIVMILGIIAIVIGGGYYAFNQLMPQDVVETQGPIYATQEVIKGDISVGVEAKGNLDPSKNGSIRSPEGNDPMTMSMQYKIDKIVAEEGTEVKEGDVIVRLSSTDLDNKIDKLKEDIEDLRKRLSQKTGVSMDEIDNINPYQGLAITAPISGKVINFSIEEGDKIEGQSTIAKIVDDSKFKVEAKLTPGEFEKVKVGQSVLLSFPYFDGFYEGKITKTNPNPVPNDNGGFGTTFIHWITIESENPGLVQPNMDVNVGLAAEGKSIPSFNFMYVAKVTGFGKEEKVLNPVSNEVIVTKVHIHDMEKVEKGTQIVSMAGPDVRDMIQEDVDKIRDMKSQLDSYVSQRGQLEVKATMDGVVARMYREVGETIRSGEWLGSIYTTDEMRIWTQVDDIDVVNIKQGSLVKVKVDAVPGEVFEGSVEEVSTSGRSEDGITRFHVEIKVKGGSQLRPGMEARAFIDAGSAENVLLIPLEAVFEEDGENRVEILKDDIPKLVTVKLGLMNDRYAEVKSGLEEGDLVIVGSTADLLPSQHIKSQDGILPSKGEDKKEDKSENKDSN